MIANLRIGRAVVILGATGMLLAGCGLANESAPRATVVPSAPGQITETPNPVPSASVEVSSPATKPVPDSSADGEIVCGDDPIEIGGIGETFVVVGNCAHVTVSGTDNSVDGSGITGGELSINGDRNAIVFGDAASVSMQGQSNVVSIGTVGSALISGDRNTLDSAGTVTSVTFAGNDNTVSSTNAPAVTSSGDRNVATQR